MKTSRVAKFTSTIVAAITGLYLVAGASVKSTDAKSLASLARQAADTNPSRAADAIEQLRAAGPAGLDALFDAYGDHIQRQLRPNATADESWERIRTALDLVARQRDAYASHLYWYTNFDEAKAAARASGKPILSLRLLGKLNEEYSCANSRFFRTTLYPNAEVSDYLRAHFILHWQSVRPVPRITIDMGDGRRIERTITGNSIHYVLDADGNPIDALPGLYGAKAFLRELGRAESAELQAAKLNGAERAAFLNNYHSTRLTQIQANWARDLAIVNPAPRVTASASQPDAVAASFVTISKTGVEAPMLRAGAETSLPQQRNTLDAMSTDATWQKIASIHQEDAALDASAIRLISFKQPAPTAAEAMLVTTSKMVQESPMVRMLNTLRRSIAEDTVRNEYGLHSRIHEWFANGWVPANLDALNSRVYAELFLTPNSDPWLGLAPTDAFSALDGGGLVQNATCDSK
jgi:hypothetical protein